ncbi:hypothetical protein [Paenibacillus sp. HB172176]|uniref:hypothetical protein n=1 Tax=Paenibacillus sp. HB172176 TaxID=2493690 RepID=UPI00143ADDDB|nr:hypothetical protein [Paenibacillus sp. HB172176]
MTAMIRFPKEKLLSSKQFTSIQKDVLAALLDDHEAYTIDEAKQKLNDYLNKEAK